MAQRHKGISRRNFFLSAGAAGLGAALAVPGLEPAPALAAPSMPQRVFGKTGVKVSILSLGGMFDIPNNQIVLKQALALGVNYWDTANSYSGGNSEIGIGQFFSRNPGVREKIFLVTKSTNRSAQGLSEHLELSLKKMQTKYVDLFFVHSVTDIAEMTPELLAWSKKAKASGKIKYFGFSTHRNMGACLAGAAKLDGIDGIMSTYNYRCLGDKELDAAVEACHKKGIGLTAMKTMGEGPSPFFSTGDMALLDRFQKRGFSMEQAKLKAVWRDTRFASLCSQMPNLSLVRTNAAAAMDQTKLSAADLKALGVYARATAAGYCAGCAGICQGCLSQPAPVAEVMRSLMYYQSYQETELARQTFRAIDPGLRGLLTSTDYSLAESRCPQGLPISRLMRQAVSLLA